jgi:hypothetical protein
LEHTRLDRLDNGTDLVFKDGHGGGTTIDLCDVVDDCISAATVTIYHENYFGYSTNGTTQATARNMTMTRTSTGQWNVVFATAHPDGARYHPSVTAEEQSNIRDTPLITVVQGSQTANGFRLQIVTGDNGGSADGYVDTPFSVGVCAPISVLAP